MKIIQVINSLNIGGAEKLILDLVPLLKQRGLEVDVLLLNGENTAFKKALEKQSVNVYSLGTKNNIYNPLLIFRLCWYMRRYDLMHVHLFPAQYWVALAKLLSFSKVKLLYTEHSTTNRRRKKIMFKPIDRFIYSLYKKIITISYTATEFLSIYLHKNNCISTIQNGVHISSYRDAAPYSKNNFLNIKEDTVLITMVASFRLAKDQQTLILAMSHLPDKYHLVLVGDGIRKDCCEQLVSQSGLNNRVHFLGLRDDVPRILKTSDLIVMSSHYEGLSLSSIEGMASGKPFLASNVNGLREITEGAGVLFEEGNENELAEKIQSLMNHPDEYTNISQKCQNRAAEYDIQKTVNRYIEMYNEVMSLS